MNKILKNWIKKSASKDYKSCNFCAIVSTVFIGVKPAEILIADEKDLTNCILLKKSMKVKVLSKNNGRYKLFIYNESALTKTLTKKLVLKYLRVMGYDYKFSLESYVKKLTDKISKSAIFPHEIGFFLGYPVKDVLGFMGLVKLPLTRTQGWRMYGDIKESCRIYEEIRFVREWFHEYALKLA